jgi:hypothetical protein
MIWGNIIQSTSENSKPGGTTNDFMPDLSGDFDSNFNNLLYAQGCLLGNPTNQFYYQMMPPTHAQYWNPYEYAGTNEAVPSPPHSPGYFVLRPFHQIHDHVVTRAYGTGLYFPNPVCSLLAHSFLCLCNLKYHLCTVFLLLF